MADPITWTVRKVVNAVLEECGISDPVADDQNKVLRKMQLLLGQWSADRDMRIQNLIPVAGYAALDDTVDLPPEYVYTIIHTLVIETGPDYGKKASQSVASLAALGIATIKQNNNLRNNGTIPPNGTVR